MYTYFGVRLHARIENNMQGTIIAIMLKYMCPNYNNTKLYSTYALWLWACVMRGDYCRRPLQSAYGYNVW